MARTLATKAAQPRIPKQEDFSRFLANLIGLEEAHGLVSDLIPQLKEQLMHALPVFGKHLSYDGKATRS